MDGFILCSVAPVGPPDNLKRMVEVFFPRKRKSFSATTLLCS